MKRLSYQVNTPAYDAEEFKSIFKKDTPGRIPVAFKNINPLGYPEKSQRKDEQKMIRMGNYFPKF